MQGPLKAYFNTGARDMNHGREQWRKIGSVRDMGAGTQGG